MNPARFTHEGGRAVRSARSRGVRGYTSERRQNAQGIARPITGGSRRKAERKKERKARWHYKPGGRSAHEKKGKERREKKEKKTEQTGHGATRPDGWANEAVSQGRQTDRMDKQNIGGQNVGARHSLPERARQQD